jgi:hypothetical protein
MLRKKHYSQRGISQGQAGFSTSGTVRTGNYIGKTSMNSSVHTPFRGAYPMGHGGSNGSYIVNNCSAGTPSNGQSTMTTSGLLLSKVKHPTALYNKDCDSQCSVPIHKDTSPLNHSSGIHTKTLVSKQLGACNNTNVTTNIVNCSDMCGASSYHIGGKKYVLEPYVKDVATMSASEYLITGVAKKIHC